MVLILINIVYRNYKESVLIDADVQQVVRIIRKLKREHGDFDKNDLTRALINNCFEVSDADDTWNMDVTINIGRNYTGKGVDHLQINTEI